MADFDIITERSELEALARDLLREKVVAVDTEADSFYHYYDKTCLVQVATQKHAWLIDPLALGGPAELAPLGPMFASPDVRVLFHAAEYDIFVLKRDCQFTFTNLFDTMISSQLLGYEAIGLGALIEHHFGVHLPKDEQRSDWSRRPLTEKQLSYAISDVLYLIKLAEKLEAELEQAGRLGWALTDFEAITHREWPDREFDKLGYLRIKGARTLDMDTLAVLRELFLMRDLRAREIDRPPFKVIGNRALLELATLKPTDLEGLAPIKGISELMIRRMGPDIVKAIQKGIKKPHGPIPKLESTSRRRMDRRTERRLQTLKSWRGPRAQTLKLDPGVLCPNVALEAIACCNPQSAADLEGLSELKGWFAGSFGEEVVEVLSSAKNDGDAKPPEKSGNKSDPKSGDASTKSSSQRESSTAGRRKHTKKK